MQLSIYCICNCYHLKWFPRATLIWGSVIPIRHYYGRDVMFIAARVGLAQFKWVIQFVSSVKILKSKNKL